MPAQAGLVTSLLSLLVISTILQRQCEGCDREETVGMDDSFIIKTPYYPDNYPPSLNCVYRFTAGPGYRLRLFFTTFQLEPENSAGICSFDFVKIFDGDTTQDSTFGTFCGDNKPPAIVSSGRDLIFLFTSDDSIQTLGFRTQVTAVSDDYREPLPTPAPGSCTTILRQSGGGFYSPGYPDSYLPDQTCIYIVSLPDENQHVLLRFTSFDLEPSYQCVYDYVEVRDGVSAVSPIIGRYCGGSRYKPPRLIESSGPDIYVVFHSDVSAVFEGFYAEYASSDVGFESSGAGGTDDGISGTGDVETEETHVSVCDFSHALMTDRGGTVVSHNNYPLGSYAAGLTCSMVFVGSQINEKVFINVVEMDLPGGRTCNEDSIRIIDGDLSNLVTGQNDLTTLCGTTIGQYTSSSLFAVIQFMSDGTRDAENSGFKLVYSIYYEDPYGCQDDDFHCTNSRCIAKSLKCDGYDHCGDDSDENKGCKDDERQGRWMIAIIFFASMASLVVAGSIAFFVMKNAKKAPPQNNNFDTNRLTGLSSTSRHTMQENSASTVSQPVNYANHAYELPREPVASAATIDAEVQQQPPSYSQIFDDPAHPPAAAGAPNEKQLYPKQQHTMFLAAGLGVAAGENTSATGQLPPLLGPSGGLHQNSTPQSLPPIRGTPNANSLNDNP